MQAPQTETYTVIRRTWLSERPSAGAQLTVAVSLGILAIGSGMYWNNTLGAADWMAATGQQIFQQKQFWRLWTTLFAHSDLGHLAANSLLFVVLGYFLTGYFGPLVFPLSAFLFGGITNIFSVYTYDPQMRLIGASGMVSWMGGAWLTLYMLLNRKLSVRQRVIRAFGVSLVLFAPSETFDPHISYRTHMIGFALGVGWAALYFRGHRAEFRAAEVSETITEPMVPEPSEFNTGPLDEEDEPW